MSDHEEAETGAIEDRCPHYGFRDLSRCGICAGVDS